jgi:hypothetical protein
MKKNFPWEQFDKVIFERGICIRRSETGGWFYANSEDAMSVSDPNTVLTNFGVRPVLAEGSSQNAMVSFLLPATRGRLLEIYRSELNLFNPLKYVMGSMIYHCSALTRLYAEACSRFAEQATGEIGSDRKPSREKENKVVTRLEAPFFEFETLMTKIILGYETIRYPIWRKYQSGTETPRNFADTIKRCKLPPAIEKRIILSKDNCYLPAKKFRHCIQRNLDIGSSSWCMFEKKYEMLWLFLARLPDNPEEKSATNFKFDQKLDALTMAWEYVSEFFALTDIIVGKGNLSSA